MSSSYLSRPFSNHSPSGFFNTPELSQRLTLILHLINHSEQLLLVMGEKGYGKTTLLKKVIQQSQSDEAQAHWKLFHLSHDSVSLSSQHNLLTTLLSAFGEQTDGRKHQELISTLRGHIANTRYNAQLPLLVIDDAHMLPLETLHLLLKLAMQGDISTRLRILLFSEPQITSIFAAPEFEIVRNNLIHTLDIPAFNVEQTGAYIQLQLHQANFKKENPFTPERVRYIHQQSQGVPAVINELALEVLKKKQGLFSEYSTFGGWLKRHGYVFKWLFIGLIFIALVTASHQLKQHFFPKTDTPHESEMETDLAVDELNIEADAFEATTSNVMPLFDDELDVEPEIDIAEELLEEDNFEPTEETVVIPPLNEEILDIVVDDNAIKDSRWLQQQSPKAYTIQILGAYKQAQVDQFIKKYNLSTGLAVFQTTHKQKPWHVLLYGHYPNRQSAINAIETLPVALRKATQPWVRSFASIHSQLKE